jgi:multisubunit Na+/H+ antiporter MnhE subunit
VKGDKTARIVLNNDGSITITGSAITLDAGTGTIDLKAANVNVKVTGKMDVS